MPFYRSNPKSGGGGADYDSFYITVNGQDKYLPLTSFLQKQFPNNYNTTFNDPIIIGDNVSDCSNFMPNARAFNSPLTIGKRVKYMDCMCQYDENFNQPITISSYAINCQNAFYYCNNFNQPITFNNVIIENAYVMFFGLNNFNHPINIVYSDSLQSSNIKNLTSMFQGCHNFNSPFSIINGKNLILNRILWGCTNFNSPVNLETSTISSMDGLFTNCSLFNQPVNVGYSSDYNGNIIVSAPLNNALNFNSPIRFVDLGNDTGNLNIIINGLFTMCPNYNQPFIVPPQTNSLTFLCFGANKFNSPIIFENCRRNIQCSSILRFAVAFNQEITFPSNVYSLTNAFENCTSFGNNVYFKGNVSRTLSTIGMFRNCNRSKRKTIWCNAVLTNNFLGNAAGNSITGTTVKWTTTTNGYYNATYNIYIYNNYEG